MLNNSIFELVDIDLQLFADGGDSGTGAVVGESGATEAAAVPRSGAIEQDAAAQVDVDKEFDDLIKGKYKDSYNKRTKETIEKRLRGTSEKIKAFESVSPIIKSLAERYNVDATDFEGLRAAIEKEDAEKRKSAYAEEAYEKGLSVEEVEEMHRIKDENEQFRREKARRESEENIKKIHERWSAESEELKKTYPKFDFDSELKNDIFRAMIANGFPVKNAYESVHHDELTAEAVAFAVQDANQKFSKNVLAGAGRPVENGNSAQAPSTQKAIDVSKMTADELLSLARRAERGERITLKN